MARPTEPATLLDLGLATSRSRLTDAIVSSDRSRNDLPKVAAAGIVTGLLTPLCAP